MNTKTKMSAFFASATLAVLLASLFVPLFYGIGYMSAVTASIWELSHILALFCAMIISGIILMPLFRPSPNLWYFPFLLGVTLFISAICAAVYTLVLADRFNLYFHPYSLIVVAIGALLCAIEGISIKSELESIKQA